ncbi:MAG: hypothetical protein PWQ67_2664 [Clostridia bacterium]|jgi:hypothetical protein|nr:hypothetical protein [Clostridia bacterium]
MATITLLLAFGGYMVRKMIQYAEQNMGIQ